MLVAVAAAAEAVVEAAIGKSTQYYIAYMNALLILAFLANCKNNYTVKFYYLNILQRMSCCEKLPFVGIVLLLY